MEATNTTERTIQLESGAMLGAFVRVPVDPQGLIVFAHGSGSSRHSPRNNFVAQKLYEYGMATLLADLLTPEEDANYRERFNIELLSERLVEVTYWAVDEKIAPDASIGYFGASTGAAAALDAATALSETVRAVVSRGGRPDLAPHLDQVLAPTLLIVGGDDFGVIELNQVAYQKLTCVKELTIVPGATHLFEEPDTLEQVADLAAAWFARHLPNDYFG